MIYQKLSKSIEIHINSIIHDEFTAKEICQETFLKAWQKLDQWKGSGKIKSWIYRIATNLSLNYLRDIKNKQLRESDLSFSSIENDEAEKIQFIENIAEQKFPGPEKELINKEILTVLNELVENLPEPKQSVFRAVMSKNQTIEEIAKDLGIPTGTVKSRYHYAFKIIKQKLVKIFDFSRREGDYYE